MFEFLIVQGQHHLLVAIPIIVVCVWLLARFFHGVGQSHRSTVHKNSYIKPYQPPKARTPLPKW